MKLDRRTVLAGTAAAFAAPLLAALPARADAKRQSLVDSCLESARKVLGGKDFPDAAKHMTTASGVLIIPELVQGGFILGAAGGRGALMARSAPRDWSPPAFYGMGSGSLGLQIGAKVLGDRVHHPHREGPERHPRPQVQVRRRGRRHPGRGRHRRRGRLDDGGGADIVAFANSAGLFAGASLEGSYLDADNDWNALYYGPGATDQGDRARPALHQSRRRADPHSTSPSGELAGCRRRARRGRRTALYLAAGSAAAEEAVAAVGLEARHARAGRHLEALQDLARFADRSAADRSRRLPRCRARARRRPR